MKFILPLILALLVAALPPAAGATTVRDCGKIAFTPNSDDIASEITARGVTCRTARRFVRAVGGHAPKRYRGYACTKRARDTALASWRYRCVDGGRRISWVKT